jgi:hypothetical protein
LLKCGVKSWKNYFYHGACWREFTVIIIIESYLASIIHLKKYQKIILIFLDKKQNNRINNKSAKQQYYNALLISNQINIISHKKNKERNNSFYFYIFLFLYFNFLFDYQK